MRRHAPGGFCALSASGGRIARAKGWRSVLTRAMMMGEVMGMKISEKLQQMRRRSGFSQEQLAERLGVARQTVSKWENGQALPEVGVLLALCDLYGVSLDLLLRGEDGCAQSVAGDMPEEPDCLTAFLLRAKRSTYAAKGKEAAPSRPASHDFAYAEGNWRYIDTYLGGERFAGEEAVWREGVPVWSMNYMGRVLGGEFSGDFLKEALMRGTQDMPQRGPALYAKGAYTYHCRVDGDMDWFIGQEEILLSGRRIYECRFHGGKII